MPDDKNEQGALEAEAGPHKSEESLESPVYNSESQPYLSAPEITPELTPVVPAPLPSSVPAVFSPPPAPPPPPKDPEAEDEDETPEEKGMLRMSFMGHLEELRTRLLRSIIGVLLAFILSITFCKPLWNIISAPAVQALKNLGINPPNLVYVTPMEGFNVIYIKLPLLVSIFLGSPWILYQVWAFISPGLYKREKRWAVPFVVSTAGLFITGGLFAYFVAFRFGLEFLLGVGRDINVSPMVSIDTYFDLFVNVTLGVGLVFEMPVIIFFLTLLRLASPRFLMRHSRYAILAITIIAAIVTPTPDVFNMMIFAVPMVLLFFVGVFLSYLLVLKREGKSFPWTKVLLVVLGMILLMAGVVAILIYRYHFHLVQHWPFLLP
jgi:sec-independent protein translocase protein TatC